MTTDQIKEQREWLDTLTGYTPGPWSFEMEQDEWPDHALIGGDGDPVLEWDFDLGFRISSNNAHLIAAAPEMHRLLTALLAENERLRHRASELASQIHRLSYAGAQFEALLLPKGADGPEYRSLQSATATAWRKAQDEALRAALKGATDD